MNAVSPLKYFVLVCLTVEGEGRREVECGRGKGKMWSVGGGENVKNDGDREVQVEG